MTWRIRIPLVACWIVILVAAADLLTAIAAEETHECLFRTLPWEPCK